jgi:transposase
MIPSVSRVALMPITKAKFQLDSIVYTDTLVTYDSIDVSGFHHHRINHGKTFAVKGGNKTPRQP